MSVSILSAFALSCIGSGLATGSSPGQRLLPTVYRIHSFKINSFLMGSGQGAYSWKAEEGGQETSKYVGNFLYYITECTCKPVTYKEEHTV
jgi:hypothetical protein